MEAGITVDRSEPERTIRTRLRLPDPQPGRPATDRRVPPWTLTQSVVMLKHARDLA